MKEANKISEILKNRVLVLDGAMGTMIQRYKLTESDYRGNHFASNHIDLKGCNDLLCLTKPEVIREIHRAYLDADTIVQNIYLYCASNELNTVCRRYVDIPELAKIIGLPQNKIVVITQTVGLKK